MDVDTYKSKFLGANARAYLFICKVEFPGIQNALLSGLSAALSNPGNIGDMISKGLVAGGTTAINTFGNSFDTQDFKYFVKSTSLPESSVEESSTYFCGQQYKMSSVRRSQDWSVTFLVNNDASILKKFWDWHLIMQNPETGMYGKPKDYMTNQVVQLLGMDGNVICTYKLFSAWPKTIGQVSLDYATNEFATVDITFSYQYHTVTQNEESGLAKAGRQVLQSVGGSIIDKFF